MPQNAFKLFYACGIAATLATLAIAATQGLQPHFERDCQFGLDALVLGLLLLHAFRRWLECVALMRCEPGSCGDCTPGVEIAHTCSTSAAALLCLCAQVKLAGHTSTASLQPRAWGPRHDLAHSPDESDRAEVQQARIGVSSACCDGAGTRQARACTC